MATHGRFWGTARRSGLGSDASREMPSSASRQRNKSICKLIHLRIWIGPTRNSFFDFKLRPYYQYIATEMTAHNCGNRQESTARDNVKKSTKQDAGRRFVAARPGEKMSPTVTVQLNFCTVNSTPNLLAVNIHDFVFKKNLHVVIWILWAVTKPNRNLWRMRKINMKTNRFKFFFEK